MIKQMLKTIEAEDLIHKGDKIVVAVSGGPDSVCLLHALWSIKEEYNLALYVCHLNHMLRGEMADADAEYVKTLSDELGLDSFIFTEDIEAYAHSTKMSFEEAAREKRYELFDLVCKQTGATKIAVAQNKNDQAETLLMRLFRGSGLEGLTAIKFKRDHIIRPILGVSREMIEAYCLEHQLKTRTDHTNFETDYTRNKIRLELIPYIKEHFNSNIIEGLYQTTQLLNQDLSYIEQTVDDIYKTINKKTIKLDDLSLDDAILSRLIRRLLSDQTGSLKGVTFDQINALLDMIKNRKHGNKMNIKGLWFEISYADLLIGQDHIRNESSVLLTNQPVQMFDQQIERVTKGDSSENLIVIDTDKIKGQLQVRSRQNGDRFKPLGMSGHKKLKDFFIDLKIPVHKRDQIVLLCDDERIIWVIGYRLSEDYKVTAKTTHKTYIKNCKIPD
jgi:tRNA(Ile)-lysidine synthase